MRGGEIAPRRRPSDENETAPSTFADSADGETKEHTYPSTYFRKPPQQRRGAGFSSCSRFLVVPP
jgi:hypothetical protein